MPSASSPNSQLSVKSILGAAALGQGGYPQGGAGKSNGEAEGNSFICLDLHPFFLQLVLESSLQCFIPIRNSYTY